MLNIVTFSELCFHSIMFVSHNLSQCFNTWQPCSNHPLHATPLNTRRTIVLWQYYNDDDRMCKQNLFITSGSIVVPHLRLYQRSLSIYFLLPRYINVNVNINTMLIYPSTTGATSRMFHEGKNELERERVCMYVLAREGVGVGESVCMWRRENQKLNYFAA